MPPFELLVGGAYLLFWLGVAAVHEYGSRRLLWRSALWRDAAHEVGLSSIVELGVSTVAAYPGGLRVRFADLPKQDGYGTRLEIEGPGLAPGLTLGPEPRAALVASRSPREIELGDDDFDREVALQGPPAVALAVLDSTTRHALRTLLRGPFQIRGHPPLWVTGRLDTGVLRVNVPHPARLPWPRPKRGEPVREPGSELAARLELAEVLRAALDLAERLVVPGDLARRLASQLSSERNKGVRLRTLAALVREFPESEATRAALSAARDDEDEELRLRAAVALGLEGRDVLLRLAAGEEAGDATSARAVTALGASLTAAKASELLKGALRARRLEAARACLSLLADHGSGAVPTLAKVLLVEKSELGEAAARALAATGDPAAEAPLLRALTEGTPELRRAAVAALGRVGTRDAVAPLREAESHDAALRGVARQAVAQIHSRLAGAAQGQLSLAGGESGRLSLAQDESGRLSLSDGTQG